MSSSQILRLPLISQQLMTLALNSPPPLRTHSDSDCPSSSSVSSSTLSEMASVRAELLAYFTHVLQGDALAAEYLILHLISDVYATLKFQKALLAALRSEQTLEFRHVIALLLLLLPCRYSRRDVLPLGKFTLNISGCPAVGPFTQRLYQNLQQLVPSVRVAAAAPSQKRQPF